MNSNVQKLWLLNNHNGIFNSEQVAIATVRHPHPNPLSMRLWKIYLYIRSVSPLAFSKLEKMYSALFESVESVGRLDAPFPFEL